MVDAVPAATCTVAVIGAGPAGLAAAIALRRRGIANVVVLERDAAAGGVPRHCGHIPFGWREYRRCLTGPRYAARLAAEALNAGVELWLNASVVRLYPGGRLLLSSAKDGRRELQARRVVLATGGRETPRAARLVSGPRPSGVVTTGALQALVYLNQRVPFRRPLIVGTELVAFSALLTCRHARIKPVAMLEANARITVPRPSWLLPLAMNVPVLVATQLLSIVDDGRNRVRQVRVIGADHRAYAIDCDGVIFSGRFVPEAALLTMSHLRVDRASGGPVIDQYGRCSDPAYFAAGNLLRPIETAGWSWQEGRRVGAAVAASLAGELPPAADSIEVLCHSDAIKYVIPHRLVLPHAAPAMAHLQLRLKRPISGRLRLSLGAQQLWSKRLRGLPERRVLIPLSAMATAAPRPTTPLTVAIDAAKR